MFIQFVLSISLLSSTLQAFESIAYRNDGTTARSTLHTGGLYPRTEEKKASSSRTALNTITNRLDTGLSISGPSNSTRWQTPRRRPQYTPNPSSPNTKDHTRSSSPSKVAERPIPHEQRSAALREFLHNPPGLGLDLQGDIIYTPPSRSPSPPRPPRNRWPDPHPKLGPLAAKPVAAKVSFKGPAMIQAHTGKRTSSGQRTVEHLDHRIKYDREYSDPHSVEVYLHTDKSTTGRNIASASGGRRASVRSFRVSSTLTPGSGTESTPPPGWKITKENELVGKPRKYLKASTRTYETPVSVVSKFKGAGLTILRASNSDAGSATSRESSISGSDSESTSSSGLTVSSDEVPRIDALLNSLQKQD